MIQNKDVLTVVLAGGKGERLGPLTRERAKPAVHFGGIYRIVDLTLSNCVNSGLRKILVLTQYMSRSLSRHLHESWRFISRPTLGEFIEALPPQHREGDDWYRGTADALYQNLHWIEQENPGVVLVLAGDHIYKMDYRHMIDLHREKDADVIVAAVEVPAAQATAFGVLQVAEDGRVVGFQEKPAAPAEVPGHTGLCLASMGIYTFRPSVLREALVADAANPQSTRDIGRDLIGRLMKNKRVYAFPFIDENKKASKYWRDVGTVDAFWAANMDLVSVDPELNLYDAAWPIHTTQVNAPPPKFVFAAVEPGGRAGIAIDSLVSSGSILSGGRVTRSILSPFVRVHSYAQVAESVLFHGVDVGRHCRIRRAIIEKGVVLPEGAVVGEDPAEDRKRFYVSAGGVAVITKSAVF
jgi:glucose-1-phosphate adenylyltransferase